MLVVLVMTYINKSLKQVEIQDRREKAKKILEKRKKAKQQKK